MASLPLNDWNNFYVITGGAAAGLTGLTFEVIALAADARRVDATGLRAFVTPIVVHFGTVLALAAFLCVPRQTSLSLSVGSGGAGAAGLIYVGIITWNIVHNLRNYLPLREDWVWHIILPCIAYGALTAMAALIWRRAETALYGVAAATVLLLFIGIHNAWDIAVWMSLRKQESMRQEDSGGAKEAPPRD